jgi:hypothetical protein
MPSRSISTITYRKTRAADAKRVTVRAFGISKDAHNRLVAAAKRRWGDRFCGESFLFIGHFEITAKQ